MVGMKERRQKRRTRSWKEEIEGKVTENKEKRLKGRVRRERWRRKGKYSKRKKLQ